MKIVIAPDSFKESLTAKEVCRAIEHGARKVYPNALIIRVPLADGGEGTLDALCGDGKIFQSKVSGPLGKKISARWGMMADGSTAVVEMSQASGLALVPPSKRNPMLTSSFGTGEQIIQALNRGAKKIILTLGGVATSDAATGMARALGYRFLDKRGQEIPEGAAGLASLYGIDASRANPRLKKALFVAACDVKNPLCGREGSARVYGPQKGATPVMVKKIEAGFRRLALIARRDLKVNVLNIPGGGAAGGAGAGAAVFLNARLKPGVDLVFQAVNFEKKIKGADLVITGEGRIDGQTLQGKTILGVARLASRRGIPVFAYCGETGEGYKKLLGRGVSKIISLRTPGMNRLHAMKEAGPLLMKKVAETLCRGNACAAPTGL